MPARVYKQDFMAQYKYKHKWNSDFNLTFSGNFQSDRQGTHSLLSLVQQGFQILDPFLKVFQRASSTGIYEQPVLDADHMGEGNSHWIQWTEATPVDIIIIKIRHI